MILPVNETPDFFIPVLAMVDEDVLKELNHQMKTYPKFIEEIPDYMHLHRYALGKWTIKEMVGHITDTERIKLDAALRIARNDKVSIPGFDENQYVQNTDFNHRSMGNMLEEFLSVRKSAILLYESLSEEELKRIGTASGKPVSSRALFYFLVGHVRHHEKILKKRYLIK